MLLMMIGAIIGERSFSVISGVWVIKSFTRNGQRKGVNLWAHIQSAIFKLLHTSQKEA